MVKSGILRGSRMKTLILISHPQLADSATQQFLKTAGNSQPDVTFQHIDERYQNGNLDVVKGSLKM